MMRIDTVLGMPSAHVKYLLNQHIKLTIGQAGLPFTQMVFRV